MILSLRGRLETRLFLTFAVALPWATALAALWRPGGGPAGVSALSTAVLVGLMGGLGLLWELTYHALQQLRWDRDWPSALALAAVVPEGTVLWFLAGATPDLPGSRSGPAAFAAVVGTAWLAMWAFAQGPMRVLFVRWRMTGGRISCGW